MNQSHCVSLRGDRVAWDLSPLSVYVFFSSSSSFSLQERRGGADCVRQWGEKMTHQSHFSHIKRLPLSFFFLSETHNRTFTPTSRPDLPAARRWERSPGLNFSLALIFCLFAQPSATRWMPCRRDWHHVLLSPYLNDIVPPPFGGQLFRRMPFTVDVQRQLWTLWIPDTLYELVPSEHNLILTLCVESTWPPPPHVENMHLVFVWVSSVTPKT